VLIAERVPKWVGRVFGLGLRVLLPRDPLRLTGRTSPVCSTSMAWHSPQPDVGKTPDMTAVTRSLQSPLGSLHSPLANVIAPSLLIADSAAAAVFAAVRHHGPVARDAIATGSGLSIATVNRQVSALLEAHLLRERPDLATPGAIGRPRIPVEINHEPYLTLGLHIGARTTSVVASDLFGRTLDAVETPTPGGSQSSALASLADSSRRYLSRWHRRRPLWVGIAVGGVVDSAGGLVDHHRLGWVQAPVGPALGNALGMPVSVAAHVDAMAGAELLFGTPGRRITGTGDRRSGLYFYARETVGFAQVIDGRVYTPASGPGTIASLPVRSELLGGAGTLESTVSDEAVVAAARKRGILPVSGPGSTVSVLMRISRHDDAHAAEARELLAERTRVLGGAIALLRDILNPDEIVVGGQAFTEYPEGFTPLRAAVAQGSSLPVREVRLTRFGNRVQESGAGVVSLSSLYADPLGAVRRAHRTADRMKSE
jgi:predicted NBD/HSP70 family sugar kinase